MQYKFAIKPMFHSYDYSEKIGEIDKTVWSIRATWRSAYLQAVEVQRTDSTHGKVNIELCLRCCGVTNGHDEGFYNSFLDCYDEQNQIFEATLGENIKIARIFTQLALSHGYLCWGHVAITIPSNCKTNNNKSVPSSAKLSDDFLRLLDNPSSFPDATLRSGTVKIPVHRNILSARSPVLAAIFSSQMQEGLSSTVNITDIQLEVLQSTLRYIYGGTTDGLTDELAADLLFAADKYQLDELKSVCTAKLKSSVNLDNVFHVLVLGDLHDRSLKTHAMDFLCRCNCFSQLEGTEEWKRLEKEYPSLAMEVLKSIVVFVEQK